MEKFKTRGHQLVFVFLIMGFSLSCDKEEITNQAITKLKTYDDSLANPENVSIRITSGSDKLFMVYGTDAPFDMISGAIFIIDYQVKIMATSLNGDLLWKNTVATNLDVNDVIAMDDGGCVTVSFNYWNSSNHTQSHIYLHRFNSAGNLVSSDSVTAPASIATNYYLWQVGGCKAANGNIILYFTFNNSGAQTCIGEYSFTSGWVWCKKYRLLPNAPNELSYINDATQSNNGYVFAVKASNDLAGNGAYALLLSTNLGGDTLWTWKQYDSTDVIIGYNNVVFSNGIYLGFNSGPYGNMKSNISHVDTDGNLLGSISQGFETNYYLTSVNANSAGGISCLSNKYGNAVNSYTDPIFSSVNTNLLKSDAMLNEIYNGPIQTKITDFLPASCTLPDGKTVCFGMIQPNGRKYYKPAILIAE